MRYEGSVSLARVMYNSLTGVSGCGRRAVHRGGARGLPVSELDTPTLLAAAPCGTVTSGGHLSQ